jgi:hypothetical protein
MFAVVGYWQKSVECSLEYLFRGSGKVQLDNLMQITRYVFNLSEIL